MEPDDVRGVDWSLLRAGIIATTVRRDAARPVGAPILMDI
jgi:hypothetical protein